MWVSSNSNVRGGFYAVSAHWLRLVRTYWLREGPQSGLHPPCRLDLTLGCTEIDYSPILLIAFPHHQLLLSIRLYSIGEHLIL